MQVVITGCGRTGRALATRLDAEGDMVTVIELDDTVERGLPAGFRSRFVLGNAINPRVLEAAGIAHAEALVALTPNDSANIVSARVARDIYRVPHVLARLHDPAHAPVYTQFGIATIGSVQTTVNRVIQLLHHRALEPHQTFGNGETLLVRSRVPAYLAGRRVAEFNVPGEIGVVELSRAGHSKIPEPSTPLEDGDVLSFIVAAASLGRLRSFLGGKWS
jgi:trk system potassium uptake protein TrkA